MDMKMSNKTRNRSLVVAFVICVTVAFFEKINGLITFTYTKEITLVQSEQVTIGWLEAFLKPFSLGLFSTFTSLTGVIVMFSLVAVAAAFLHLRKHQSLFILDERSDRKVVLGSYSNRAKTWFCALFVYAALEVVTSNFNMMTIANVWRFNFHGGASVPTSPLSLTYIGTMIEYYYMVSIKHFFNATDRSLLEIVIWSSLALWVLLKAHAVTTKQVGSAKSVKELISIVPAALLAVLTAAFAPYRLSESTELEEKEVNDDIRSTLAALRLPKTVQDSFISRMNNEDSIFYLLKDRHANYTHYLMNRINRGKE